MQPALRTARRKTVIGLIGTLLFLAAVVAAIATPSWILRQHIHRATLAIRARNYEEALQWLNKATKLGPHHPHVQFLFARAQRHLENFDEAAVHLSLAQTNGLPKQLVDLELRLSQVQNGEIAEAAPYIGTLLVTAGRDQLEVYEAFTRGFLAQRRFGEVEKMLKAWNQITSGDSLAYMYRGHNWAAQYRWSEAVEAYRASVKFDNQNVDANYGLGRGLLELGEFAEAEKSFRHCLELSPDHVAAHAGLATCLLEKEDIQQARELLDKAAKTTRFNDQLQLGLARAAFLEHQYEEALEQLQPVLEKWPEDEKACLLQVEILDALNRSEEAATARENANKATAQLATLPSLLKAATDDPSAATHYEIGVLLLEHGSRTDARQWIEASLLIYPTNREARQTLIRYLDQIGDKPNADFHRKLLEVRPL